MRHLNDFLTRLVGMDGASAKELTHRLQSQMSGAVSEDALYAAIGDVWKGLQEVLKDGQVARAELVTLGVRLAGVVNRFERLSGVQKQELVLQILDGVLEQMASRDVISSECYNGLHVFVVTILPTVLTVAVSAARGEIDLKKRAVGFLGALQACLCPPSSERKVVSPSAPLPLKPTEGVQRVGRIVIVPALPPSPVLSNTPPVEGRSPSPVDTGVSAANMEIPRTLPPIPESPKQGLKEEGTDL